ncbi:MAG: T9SS type A sorting domain-containing protein [Flavobacteriales bacterium]|nr:T9SS type A sorting domain-containing protein [Flavobacteriales bacterium]
MKVSVIITFLFIGILRVQAQEVLMDLTVNPTLRHLQKQDQHLSNRIAGAGDTLSLPFRDDFSQEDVYPSTDRWEGRSVFINNGYGYNPVTYGVATFDGLKADGTPYDFSNTTQGSADTLTSLPLAMDTLKNVGDSALFSFYYQPQGRGNAPEEEDSLILQFYTPALGWHSIWNKAGNDTNITWFTKVIIPVKDTAYFKRGFRFRFRNYATLSGNIDHWHLDYVRLYIPKSAGDTIEEDVAFTKPIPSLIRNFTAMPWPHYLLDATGNMTDSMSVVQYNHYPGLQLVDNGAYVQDESGTLVHTFPTSANNQNGMTEFSYRVPVGFTFPDNGMDSAEFRVTAYKKFTNDLNKNNDTISAIQRFYNYYAYDDGTVENGYGLSVANGKIAYRFDMATTDTLRAVQMYFNQMVSSTTGHSFKLTVWAGGGTPGNILYQQIGLRPTYTDSLNKFHTYVLDSAISLSGSFYIGWVQVTPDLLNLGLDRNIISNDRMFFNTTGNWQNSQLKGSWMIRPVFGDSLVMPNAVPEVPVMNNDIEIYPNPALTVLHVRYKQGISDLLNFEVMDMTGKRVLVGVTENGTMDVSTLPAGLYMVSFSENNRSSGVTIRKFIKSE